MNKVFSNRALSPCTDKAQTQIPKLKLKTSFLIRILSGFLPESVLAHWLVWCACYGCAGATTPAAAFCKNMIYAGYTENTDE